MEEKSNKLLILYASQTGNALDAAERIDREAERRGCPVIILSMDEYDVVSLLISLWFLIMAAKQTQKHSFFQYLNFKSYSDIFWYFRT